MLKVEKWNPDKEGPLSELRLRKKLENLGYQVNRYCYPPGTVFPDHTHDTDKMDAVLSGRFLMKTPEGSAVLEAGDILRVPRGTLHSAQVIGGEPVISLDATQR